MNLRERALYHQVHPAKLLTDATAAVAFLYLLWDHELFPGLAAALLPSIAASILVMRYADLQRYKASALGRYLERYMTGPVMATRLLGLIMTALGAWYHEPGAVVVGAVVIVLAWARGLIFPGAS